jgi:hypothetical protein
VETETMRLMSEADWTFVRDVAQKTITMTGAKFTGDDTDYLVAFHLLHESEMLDLFGTIKSAYELGRRSNADLLNALKVIIEKLQGESGTGDSYWSQFPEYHRALAAIAKAEGRSS